MQGAFELSRRLMDIAGSTLGLAILALPMLIVAACIRLDSPGPALFRQVRIGKGGQPFQILKFRTMRAARNTALLTTKDDKRITRIGHYLRKTKFDEMPQLINVLKGEMSIVGPRPEVPEYAFRYPEQTRVWSVNPGITDPTAIRLRDESALLAQQEDPERFYIEVLLPMKIKGYLRYLEQRSLLYDVHVIFATLHAIVFNHAPNEDSLDDV